MIDENALDPPRPKFDTKNVVMNFGQHADKPISKVPVRYLIWTIHKRICSQHWYYRGKSEPFWKLAEAEIDRRGSITQQYSISKEAIDFISRLHYDVYIATREANEGIFSWAERMLGLAVEYIDHKADNVAPGSREGEFCVLIAGIRWYVQMEEGIPRLVSVGI
jgi:hypothetical protein